MMNAQMLRSFRPLVFAVVFVASGLVTIQAKAEKSNRNEIRANLSRNGWTVIWGKNFVEADWLEAGEAGVASAVSGNPGPFLAWFGRVLNENYEKIQQQLPAAGREQVNKWIQDSLRQKKIIKYKKLRIQAGIATIDRWEEIRYEEPRTRIVRKKIAPGVYIDVPEVYWETVTRKSNLPNWHQAYIRYKVVR